MKLSIIIVNYNVQSFLEQCLKSVRIATQHIDAEVFVVDNNSVDDSLQMLAAKFPEVKVIANENNVGFSKANNQAMRIASGEYILLLNPDTVVEYDTLDTCIQFMDKTPDCGGLGVKMIDGNGKFLPESKRGLPTPSVAFYKIFGLSKLFPKSKKFGKYHLSYLDNEQTHEIEILAGAFMMMRKTVLDQIGFLDETFFMYGEDIDLSYRITLAGYKNYYLPTARIIHYKGESTKKGSINYVIVFYKAMAIFAKKHFSGKQASLFNLAINLAIYFRAFISILKRFLGKLIVPLIDFLVIFGGMQLLRTTWSTQVFDDPAHFPSIYANLVIPLYCLCWVICMALSKAYKKPFRLRRSWQGILVGGMIILVVYALSKPEWHFSRSLILLGTAWSLLIITLERYLLHASRIKAFQLYSKINKHYAILGGKEELTRLSSFLSKRNIKAEQIFPLDLAAYQTTSSPAINTEKLTESLRLNKINNLIFCSKDLPIHEIISCMSQLSKLDIDYKIAPPDSDFLIGSQDVETF